MEHITLHEKKKDGQECVVEFDFLGKDSIRYQNSCSVERRVFKNVQLFMENKSDGDDLFDRLNVSIRYRHQYNVLHVVFSRGLVELIFYTGISIFI